MTVDPVFALSPLDQEVAQTRPAQVVTECRAGRWASDAPRRLEVAGLPDVALPSNRALGFQSPFDTLDPVSLIAALRVEQLYADGTREGLVDRTEELEGRIRDLDRLVRAGSAGCAVRGAPPAGSLMLLGLLLVGAARRGRRPVSR